MRGLLIQFPMPTLAAALMLLQHPCGAQSSNGCPVQIRHTSWKAVNSGFSPYKVKGLALHLHYMNVTDEEITEVVFDASTFYREHGAMGQSMVDNSNKSPIASPAPPGKWKKAEKVRPSPAATWRFGWPPQWAASTPGRFSRPSSTVWPAGSSKKRDYVGCEIFRLARLWFRPLGSRCCAKCLRGRSIGRVTLKTWFSYFVKCIRICFLVRRLHAILRHYRPIGPSPFR